MSKIPEIPQPDYSEFTEQKPQTGTPFKKIALTPRQISIAKARYILNCVFEDLERETPNKP